MSVRISPLVILFLMVITAINLDNIVEAASAPPPSMGFFVTSAKSKTGNLGGLVARIAFAKLWRPQWDRETRHGAPT